MTSPTKQSRSFSITVSLRPSDDMALLPSSSRSRTRTRGAGSLREQPQLAKHLHLVVVDVVLNDDVALHGADVGAADRHLLADGRHRLAVGSSGAVLV